jgi:putative redox protein
MDARVRWVEKMAFAGLSESGHWLMMDAGAKSAAPTPMEAMLMALGGCTGMDIVSILAKMHQEVTGLEMALHGDRAEDHPKVLTRAGIRFTVTGRGLDPEKVKKAVAMSHEKYCSVGGTLGKGVEITYEVEVKEA